MKIYVIEPSFINYGIEVAKKLIKKNDDLTICQTLTSNENYKDVISENYIKYLSAADITLSFENNVLLYVNFVHDGEVQCVSLDSFYNSDIVVLKNKNFNNIIETYTEDSLIILLDDKCNLKENKTVAKDVTEIRYIFERIESQGLKYLYFMGESPEHIADTVYDYLEADEEAKLSIEEEYC